jgi:hypothetical protein
VALLIALTTLGLALGSAPNDPSTTERGYPWGPDRSYVAELSEDLLAPNVGAGSSINVRRAERRREHMDEIEQVRSPA